jgi:hypothetical protein
MSEGADNRPRESEGKPRCGIRPRSLHFDEAPGLRQRVRMGGKRMTKTCRVAQRLTMALMISWSAVACGGTDSDRSEEAAEEARGNGGNGAPFEGGDGDGAGAPFKIPAIAQVGAPYPEVKDGIAQTFLDACGTPQLCVELVVEDRPLGGEPCAFSSTDPPAETEVEQGSTVTLVVVAPCPGGSPPPDDETQDDETQDDETQDDETQDDETQDDETQD